MNEKPTMIVRVDKAYGNTLIYPECEISRIFTKLLKAKSLTPEQIKLIKELGYEVHLQQIKL